MEKQNDHSADKEEIKTILEERIKAIYDRDLQGIMAIYVPGAVTFDLKEPLKNNSSEAIKRRLHEWFGTYKSPISQELSQLEIVAGADVAFSHCLTRTYGTGIKDEKFDMWYRTTTGFQKMDGIWFISHEHVSEPIDMATGKAMFELQP
jgi:ketosteroid isomerase-like protein